MKNIMCFAKFILQRNPWRVLLSCLLDASAVLFSAGLLGVAAYLIALAAMHPSYELVMLPVTEVRFFGLGRAVLRYVERLVSHDTTFMLLRDLRIKMYEDMEPQLPELNRQIRRGSLVSTAVSDVENLQEAFLRIVYPIAVSAIVFLLGILLAALFHPLLALCFGVLYASIAFLLPAFILMFTGESRHTEAEARERMYNEFIEFSYGLADIITNSRTKSWKEKLEDTFDHECSIEQKGNTRMAAAEALSVFFQGLSLCSLTAAACWLVAGGMLDGVLAAAAALSVNAAFEAAIPVFMIYTRFDKASASAGRVFGILSGDGAGSAGHKGMKPEPGGLQEAGRRSGQGFDRDDRNEAGSMLPDGNIRSEDGSRLTEDVRCLTLRNVAFSCPGRELFSHFSMELRKGQIKAITGASGTGKTSLLNLILGFAGEYTGEILIDGRNLEELEKSRRLELFSVVDGNPFLFNDTIAENLKTAKPSATKEELVEALRKTGLLERVNQSPEGLDTMVAEWGGSLSGGELQRLAIARAILKDAPFYLFDEPTAGLDTLNEKAIMELIFELKKERGVLLVTHRNVMLDRMDEVYDGFRPVAH